MAAVSRGRSLGPGKVALLAIVMLGASMAGCVSDDAEELSGSGGDDGTGANGEVPDGRDLGEDLTMEDSVSAPEWTRGDWFGIHVYVNEPGFQIDFHVDAIVVEEGSDQWTLVTDNEEIAVWHAVMDMPFLGEISRSDLSFTAFGDTVDFMYDFPLEHNKTWEADVFGTPVTFTALFEERIETTDGTFPGFLIEGVDADGAVLIRHDFVPAIGWFGNFEAYSNAGDDEPLFRVESMGFGTEWTGTYPIYEAESVLEHMHVTFLNPNAPTDPYLEPEPHTSFTVAEDADLLWGFIFYFTCGGAQGVYIVDPEGGVYDSTQTHAPDCGDGHTEYSGEAIGGDWQFLTPGAGMANVAGANLWQLWRDEGSL